ncbi:hypothetical protein EGT74_24460 [Chitinophaga lutea]|uniref:Uncharacterized protein n=1 Tax=Chitinophaga lutea TaxID=2488634 RepID=A0A3N4PP83_9BACT|nr:hypothetical protein [Chitinophaga lutea]RPE05540.1 hypothetical protein EGT74_24460 [Chitinophaga lutea]
MTEAELAVHFIDYFSDWDVYQEVPAGGIVDIVAERKPIRVALEVKKSLNFDVIEQARKNTGYFNYSYVAVPMSKSLQYQNGIQIDICKRLGVGILAHSERTYGEVSRVQEVLAPRLNRQVYKVTLEDWMKRSTAGSQNDRMTAFKYFREEMIKQVRRRPGMDIKQLFDSLPRHYGSLSSFKSCVFNHVKSGVIPGIEFRDGKYYAVKETGG